VNTLYQALGWDLVQSPRLEKGREPLVVTGAAILSRSMKNVVADGLIDAAIPKRFLKIWMRRQILPIIKEIDQLHALSSKYVIYRMVAKINRWPRLGQELAG
jgi:hypothetical protein